MSLFKRFGAWLNRRSQARAVSDLSGTRREFVYLDEVSVYSLLASHKGAIATEFNDSQTTSLNSEIGGSMGGGFGVAKAEVRSRIEDTQSRTSQVLRKATIQTSFKELHELERPALALAGVGARDNSRTPNVRSCSDLERDLELHLSAGRVIDPQSLCRGDLIEVEIVLEAHPIFRVSAIITTIREILDENAQMFSAENVDQLAEMRSVGRLLESLLAELVPISGILVDFRVTEIGGRDYLVHRDLFSQFDEPADTALRDAVVVGVAQRDLFWKDIRRVLFSGSRFTVFCRLAGEGIQDRWRPIKLMDVLNDIHPVFGEQIGDLGETALHAMEVAVGASQPTDAPTGEGQDALLRRYITMLTDSHGRQLDPDQVTDLIAAVKRPTDWAETVDGRRSVLKDVTSGVDAALDVATSPESACHLRMVAALDSWPSHSGSDQSRASEQSPAPDRAAVRFLDTEIIAIYW